MKSARAGKPPPRRRGRTLADVWFGNLALVKEDDRTPRVTQDKIRERLHPIEHSSPN